MHDGLKALDAALAVRRTPLRLFLRDDDAGWRDDRLLALIDATTALGVPLDLAVIPCACTPALARVLVGRLDATPGLLAVHQHGFAHPDHGAGRERRCEFGTGRDLAAQRDDLLQGRRLLRESFGDRLGNLFTPPWNRCAPQTPALLAELGFAALSRDRRAPGETDLPEIAVDIDWCRLRREGVSQLDGMAAALARAIEEVGDVPGPAGAVGLMLHHAAMDADDLGLLSRLLQRLRADPRVHCVSMGQLLADVPEAACD